MEVEYDLLLIKERYKVKKLQSTFGIFSWFFAALSNLPQFKYTKIPIKAKANKRDPSEKQLGRVYKNTSSGSAPVESLA